MTQLQRRFPRALVQVVLGLVVFFNCYQLATAQEGGVQVVQCGDVLSSQGKYILETDLICPTSGASAVSITGTGVHFDLGNHSITCLDGGAGVSAAGVSNTRITNGSISNCAQGILFRGVDSKVSEMSLTGNDFGIVLQQSDGNELTDNWVSDNDATGILLVESNRNKLSGNVTNNNQRSGLGIFPSDSSENTFLGNQANGNRIAGIFVGGAASENVVRGNVANNNLKVGISLFGYEIPGGFIIFPIAGPDNIIQGNTALGNAENDLFEGSLDPTTAPVFEIVRIADECANIWRGNTFVSARGPDDCIE